MKINGKRALITGGGAGIGLALAERLWASGNQVLICGRDPEKLSRAVERMKGLRAVVCDLSQAAAPAQLIEAVSAELGGLDLLVNNAAIQRLYPFVSSAPETVLAEISSEMRTNVISVMELCRLALPMLDSGQGGVILNVGSGLALAPKSSAPVYCASKAALHVFSEAMAGQMPPGVRMVEAMLPLVDTAMTAGRGSGKMSPAAVAERIVTGIESGEQFIPVGKVRLLQWLLRLAPALAKGIMRGQ